MNTAMQTLSSREVQKNFGSVAHLVGAGQCVKVTRHGRPAFFMLPHGEETEALLRQLAANRLARSLRDASATEAAKNLSFDDVGKLIDDCFA
jgi:antitoxin (DNA-binding transcriptional repressor) of toxin-antitoxin stability system